MERFARISQLLN